MNAHQRGGSLSVEHGVSDTVSRRDSLRSLGVLAASSVALPALVVSCSGPEGANALDSETGGPKGQLSVLDSIAVGLVMINGVGDGKANDRNAFQDADLVANRKGATAVLPPGTYRISGTININVPLLIHPGAVIKPESGTIVTLSGGFHAGNGQVFDMSDNGVVVPGNDGYLHPAWWGPIGTDDDSRTWKSMLTSASYLRRGQAVHVPAGDNRLWEITLNDVHLEGYGGTRKILPARGVARAADPVKEDSGFIVKAAGGTTISGVEFDTDGIPGITAVFWVGSRVWMDGGRVRPTGRNTVGVWAYAKSGSITPKLQNMWIEGTPSEESGVGLRIETSDCEMSNVTVAYCSTGIDLLAGAASLTSVHVFECQNVGISGKQANNTRFTACYIEKNGSWGIDMRASSLITLDAGTRIWSNGSMANGTAGGVRISGGADGHASDSRIDATFDDNYGSGLLLQHAERTFGEPRIVSWSVSNGGSAIGSTGVFIDSGSFDTDLRVRHPGQSRSGRIGLSPVTGDLVNGDNGPIGE